jgi:cytochrome-b5 reductase
MGNHMSILTQNMSGPCGSIDADLVKKHIAPASLKEKVKIFVCGKSCYLAIVF